MNIEEQPMNHEHVASYYRINLESWSIFVNDSRITDMKKC